jgi:hypothetical protein
MELEQLRGLRLLAGQACEALEFMAVMRDWNVVAGCAHQTHTYTERERESKPTYIYIYMHVYACMHTHAEGHSHAQILPWCGDSTEGR